MDHVVPLSLGGAKTPDNLVPSCTRCNNAKGGHWLPPNWREWLPRTIDIGTSYDRIMELPDAHVRFYLAVAARGLVMQERARRAASRALTGFPGRLAEIKLPNVRHGR